MKKILSLMVVASFALIACDNDTDTSSVTEEQVTAVVEEQVVVDGDVVEVDEQVVVDGEVVEELVIEKAPASADKPSISATHSATVSALVEAINHETREVTLRREDGKTVSFVVSEEARNLAQVQVGDILVVEYIENLDIQVMTVDNAEADAGAAAVVARTKEGEMPGMATLETLVITAIVEEINLDDNTFKLKGPQGNIQQYTARDPENLKKAAVGDLVVITQTKAFALTVQKAE